MKFSERKPIYQDIYPNKVPRYACKGDRERRVWSNGCPV